MFFKNGTSQLRWTIIKFWFKSPDSTYLLAVHNLKLFFILKNSSSSNSLPAFFQVVKCAFQKQNWTRKIADEFWWKRSYSFVANALLNAVISFLDNAFPENYIFLLQVSDVVWIRSYSSCFGSVFENPFCPIKPFLFCFETIMN